MQEPARKKEKKKYIFPHPLKCTWSVVMHAPSSSILLLILNQAVEDSAWALVPKL